MTGEESSIGRLPDGWSPCTLGDVATWSSGGTPKSGNPAFYDGDIPWVVIGDLTEGIVTKTAKTITPAGLEGSSAKLIEAGSVMLAMYGASIGRTGISGLEVATNQAIASARTDETVLIADYLLKYLQSQKDAFVRAGQGGAQPNISQTVIKAWPFALPPLAEQERIVEVLEAQLSRLDAALESVQTSLDRCRELKRSVISAAVQKSHQQIAVKDFEDVLLLQRGYDLPVKERSAGSVPVVAAAGVIGSHNEWKVDGPGVTTGRSGSIGQVQFVSERFWPLNTALYVKDFRGNHPRFIYYLLQTVPLKSYAGGSTVPSLDRKVLRGIQLPVPCLDDQVRISSSLDNRLPQIQRVIEKLEAAQVSAAALRRSLLHAAFTGKLTEKWREENRV